jgi:hypothetical protein
VTYEQLSAYWGPTSGEPYIDRINAMPKYVASRSLTQTAWNATLLGPDPSSAIAGLKDQPGKDLIKYPGDKMVLPPHTAHAATVGAEGVRCIEAPRPRD